MPVNSSSDIPPNPSQKSVRQLKWLEPLALLLPSGFWLISFLIIPTVFILIQSLVPLGKTEFGLDNYQKVFEYVGGNFIYLVVVWRSLLYAVITTGFCLILGFPIAYWLAVIAPKRWRSILLLLFVLPLWTSSLLRSYAWITILRPTGVLNTFLNFIGLSGINVLNKAEGVIIGMIYTYIPYMVLVLYTSLERLDLRLLEAASDLGANSKQTFWQITVPQVSSGIIAGVSLVSITSFSDYINPQLLGGPGSRTIASIIELQFLGASSNRGFGSALSMVLILVVTIVIALLIKYGDRRVVSDG
ncbi:MAG: ABC transporter permease [Pseudanabaena sp.]|jgi:spermidine/putrescine transport system permease protein|nr:ABC transporter permease [Pseudanabaena sp. M090S1SP2A07QC]MCA6521970.1 ABC transporter permease [Pseudanabaena sp. M051S1SP2A07QC]MCA6525854.1 ABC transporter permease [Pseudanabaena sp. M179S2SP2A07QC]MCA6531551.1 ABC transporter permease [Pseudanabaena sp. M125S2SP2A07QC]MCA6533496.1 ABC transporter permease [Pseudanabaena sp. M176S2SP2A07QC]MCA6537598.1 ABC transporter permease [Pseudanabaena sp. M037S2SP2A07QC]MCA6542429.1 ABC transporter permease [Pseudanabaena sp. M074S1SP2A07QC]MC